MRKIRNVYRILVRKCKGKRPNGGHRHRCEDNIKKGSKGMGYECGLDSSGS
jgi:hypothetical protein